MDNVDQSHIDDDRLNEYLDGALNTDQRAVVDAHLAHCNLCQDQLSELKALFTALEDLPEISLDRDLTPAILDSVRGPTFSWHAGRWLVGLQIGLTVTLLAFTWPHLLSGLTELPLDQIGLQGEAFLQDMMQSIIQTWVL